MINKYTECLISQFDHSRAIGPSQYIFTVVLIFGLGMGLGMCTDMGMQGHAWAYMGMSTNL
jgi:hypothetical protein